MKDKYFLLLCLVILCVSVLFSNSFSREGFDVNEMNMIKSEIQSLHEKVKENAKQTQTDRKYIQQKVDSMIEKLENV